MLDSDIKKYHKKCVYLARKRFPFIRDPDLIEGAVDIAVVYALQNWKDGAGFTFVGYVLLVATREIWKTMACETPDLSLNQRARFMRRSQGKVLTDAPLPPYKNPKLTREPRTEKSVDCFEVFPEKLDIDQYLEAAGKYRDVLTLRYIKGLGLKETAKVLGLSQQGTLNRIARGLNKIRSRYGICLD